MYPDGGRDRSEDEIDPDDEHFVDPMPEFRLTEDDDGVVAAEIIFTGDRNRTRRLFYTEERLLARLIGLVAMAADVLALARVHGPQAAYEIMREDPEMYALEPDDGDIDDLIRKLLED